MATEATQKHPNGAITPGSNEKAIKTADTNTKSPPASPEEQEMSSRASLQRLLTLARPEWKTLLIGTVFLLIGSGMGLLYPQGIRIVIDALSQAKGGHVINQAAIFLSVVFLFQGVAVSLRSYLFTVAGERIVTRLRQHLYHHVIQQEVGFFDTRRTGELLNRLASDTTVLQNTVSVNISMALRYLASVVGGVALLLYTSIKLTLLMLLIVPPVALGAVYFGRKIRQLSREAQDALAQASEVAEETIGGIRTVRAFAREFQESERYAERVEESFRVARKRALAGGIFGGVVSFAAYSAIAVVLWYGGHMVLDKVMTVGHLTAFLLYTLIVAFAFAALGGLFADFMRASGAGERVFSLLDRTSQIPADQGSTRDGLKGHLVFRDLTFHYPSRPDVTVLSNINMELQPGEVVALVGPSGSGKSTIASLIPRFYDPTQGEIMLDGQSLTEFEPNWLREQIGIVAQEPILFSTSIADNIRYGRPDATDEEVIEAAKVANAHQFIVDFPEQYDTEVGERGVQLSGGQKQRVAIARAVLKDPSILILDEATSALDAESEFLVKEALDRLMKGRTTLIIAHRLSTVKDADRVVVLEHGEIVQSGAHSELFQEKGLYRKLVERQFIEHETSSSTEE